MILTITTLKKTFKKNYRKVWQNKKSLYLCSRNREVMITILSK